MSEQPQVNQTGFQDVSVGGNLTANLDQSVNKTVIHQASKVNPPIPDNVPIASPNFVGRVKELEDIHAKLQGGQGVSVCAVEGMGGLGKSELALQYAWRYRQEYAARYWLSLRGVGLAQAVVTLASRYLDLPKVMQSQTVEAQAEWYWQNWTPTEGKVLVIFDDVTDLASIPRQARPLADRFQILVTTRKRKFHPYFADIPLDVISEAEALELLAKLLGKARVDREEIAAKAICKYLGYLPLGVELAGRYLQLDEDLSLSDYQQRLTIADESLDLQETEEINATRGVIAAFELSWQELSAGTGKVAMLLGLFAPADIAWGLVEDVATQLDLIGNKKTESSSKTLLNKALSYFRLNRLNFDEWDLHNARKLLINLHLLKSIDEDRTRFAVHSLIREFFKWKLSQEPKTNRLFREAFVKRLLAIAKQVTESPTQNLIANIAPAISHLDMLNREMLDDIPNHEKDVDLLWAFVGVARFYQGQGLYALAEDHFQRCVISVQKILGEQHPAFCVSLTNLAKIYAIQGKYEEAELMYLQNLDLLRKDLGKNHAAVLLNQNNLATVYHEQGKYEDAESLNKETLDLRQKYLGESHPDFAASLCNLGAQYYSQGKYKEAEPLLQKSLNLRKKYLGDCHCDVADSLNNLAHLYYLQKRYKESETLHKEALVLRQKLLGDRHHDFVTSLNNLGALYTDQGRYEKAEPLYKQALSLRKELFGDLHPAVIQSLNNLAVLYYKQGRSEKAEALYKQALNLAEQVIYPNIQLLRENYKECSKNKKSKPKPSNKKGFGGIK
ncbi:tetratricopeptide repeat protein [Pseudanabaena sp. FACHB-1998]|uniref:tetratricopeptide repeat protein n=1 Tax=Pseudanabaena sp. FACHB-1998 TaxID=2692858 RepID=UPI001681B2A4|nr:tetratricopeptide repeat protein [Pseudanabaena sp. FACHB-1998]MBD2177913.1 tetratricopeptide repeat protein [Pseudanabaena sp. FACHB-1998]